MIVDMTIKTKKDSYNLDYIREVFLEQSIFVPAAGVSVSESRIRLDVDSKFGCGHTDAQQFHNGLIVGRMDCTLKNVHYFFEPDKHPIPGLHVALMLDGWINLKASTVCKDWRVSGGEVWLGNTDIGETSSLIPDNSPLRGISFDISFDMLDDWREEAPENLHAGIRRLLRKFEPFHYDRHTTPKLDSIARRLLKLDNSSLCANLEFESLSLGLLAELLNPDNTGQGVRRWDKTRQRRVLLDEAMDILREEWTKPPTIAQLARRIGLNEFYLKNGFRETFGYTIGGYVRKLRMDRARLLIEQEGCTVKEAALSVGFSNLGHFSAAFEQYHGDLPSYFRIKD